MAGEDQLQIHPETLRRWMLAEGLWKKVRKRKQHRKRRERRAHFGELVQMDGSFHAWYENRAGKACLMNMVDDATSTVETRLGDEETIWAAERVLRQWIEKYGVPLALYTDWKNVYVREPAEKEHLHGRVPVTQLGRMCQKLDVRIIAANSPQAKGRVERGNGTHQDRLIKKMGRKKIRTGALFLQQRRVAQGGTWRTQTSRPAYCHAPNTGWLASSHKQPRSGRGSAPRLTAYRRGPGRFAVLFGLVAAVTNVYDF